MSERTIENLEERALFAAGIVATYNADNGKVSITGTSAADHIEVQLSGKHSAVVNDFATGTATTLLTIDLHKARSVTFNGGDGDDIIIMGRTPLRLYAVGGLGKDVLSASSVAAMNDTLLGNADSDYLYGGPGDDHIDGGLGDDGMIGGPGKDYFNVLSDDLGDDTVSGGFGRDTVDFGGYARGVSVRLGDSSPPVLGVDDFILNDVEVARGTGFSDTFVNTSSRPVTVYLGRGFDKFIGSRAPETVYGGRGDDTILTTAGDDVIYDSEGTNTINGGSGHDTATVIGADGASTYTGIENLISTTVV